MPNTFSNWNSCTKAQTIAVDYLPVKSSEVQIKTDPATKSLVPRLFQIAAHWEHYTPHSLLKSAFIALSQSRKNFINTKSVQPSTIRNYE